MNALNVSGGTGAPPKRGGGAFQGTCKSSPSEKGYGFIYAADGKEIFFHIKSVTDGSHPQVGDTLSYDLEESKTKPGEMQATNVTGGSAKGKGKGGKGDKGGKGGHSWGAAKGGKGGDSWGGDSWSAGPYGGGK